MVFGFLPWLFVFLWQAGTVGKPFSNSRSVRTAAKPRAKRLDFHGHLYCRQSRQPRKLTTWQFVFIWHGSKAPARQLSPEPSG